MKKGLVHGLQRTSHTKEIREVGHQTQLKPEIETISMWIIFSTHSPYCSDKPPLIVHSNENLKCYPKKK